VQKKKPLISIVDDDESLREATKGLMRAMGYAAEAFASAPDFLNSAHHDHTACLIADVCMPGMSGLELHDRLVALGQSIPTILITAHPDDRDRRRALNGGVIGYLSKPFKEDDLLDCIHSALAAGRVGQGRS
jgi:FixJ family two-component response regulator